MTATDRRQAQHLPGGRSKRTKARVAACRTPAQGATQRTKARVGLSAACPRFRGPRVNFASSAGSAPTSNLPGSVKPRPPKPKQTNEQDSQHERARMAGMHFARAAGKPVCKYGNSCYRKNPQHWLESSSQHQPPAEIHRMYTARKTLPGGTGSRQPPICHTQSSDVRGERQTEGWATTRHTRPRVSRVACMDALHSRACGVRVPWTATRRADSKNFLTQLTGRPCADLVFTGCTTQRGSHLYYIYTLHGPQKDARETRGADTPHHVSTGSSMAEAKKLWRSTFCFFAPRNCAICCRCCTCAGSSASSAQRTTCAPWFCGFLSS